MELLGAQRHELRLEVDHTLIVERAASASRGRKAVLDPELGHGVLRLRHRRLQLLELLAEPHGGLARRILLALDFPAHVIVGYGIGDGGGKVASFPKPLLGRFRIAMLYWAQQRRLGAQLAYRMALINGEPGLLHYANGRLDSAQAFVTDGERIVAIYAVRNPDKLVGVPAVLDER